MSKVYLLQHYYDYGKESEHEEVKELGVYSTRELAEEAIDRYATLPGSGTSRLTASSSRSRPLTRTQPGGRRASSPADGGAAPAAGAQDGGKG